MTPSWPFPFPWLDQTINPITTWFSPQYTLNYAGDRALEEKITADIASYGKQLGLITEALLHTAGDDQHPSITRLRQLQQDIEQLKHQQQGRLLARITQDLEKLHQQDPEGYAQLLAKLK
jgi:hypothetical protein